MNVLLVTFRLPGMNETAYRRMARRVAPKIAATPGLLGKTWLVDHTSNTYGGLVIFESRRALDAYLFSEVMGELRSDPRLTQFSATRFDTLAEASRMTKGLPPLSADRPRSCHAHAVPARPRLLWRNHDSAPVAIPAEPVPTWEDAEWR